MKGIHVVVLVLVVVALGAGGTLMLRGGRSGPLEFTLVFNDAKKLRPGQYVVYNGVRIGEVNEVDLDDAGQVKVVVEIYPKYRTTVYQEALFTIQKDIIDVSGERVVSVTDAGKLRTPIEAGTVIRGNDSSLAIYIEKAKEKLKELVPERLQDAIATGTGP